MTTNEGTFSLASGHVKAGDFQSSRGRLQRLAEGRVLDHGQRFAHPAQQLSRTNARGGTVLPNVQLEVRENDVIQRHGDDDIQARPACINDSTPLGQSLFGKCPKCRHQHLCTLANSPQLHT